MTMRIMTNVAALTARRALDGPHARMATSLERLSSGLRINRAADDAAGLAISERMRATLNGLRQAGLNAQDGISLVQTADGALGTTHAILQRMRTLAVQAANGTHADTDRAKLQAEVATLIAQVHLTATATQFNGMTLLDGTFTGRHLQIGADAGQTMALDLPAADAVALGLAAAAATPPVADPLAPAPPVTASAVKEPDLSVPGRLPVRTPYDPLQPSKPWDDWSDLGTAPTLTGQSGAVPAGTFTVDGATLTVSGGGTSGTVSANGTRIDFANGSWLQFDQPVWQDNAAAHPTGLVTVAAGAPTAPTSPTLGGPLVSLATQEAARASLTTLDAAIGRVSDLRSALGATQNRLTHTMANLAVSADNTAAAYSRIRDADLAHEMSALTRSQILAQSGTAMLAQANQGAQALLKLLG